jgi:antitoxin component of MazEF toxin-antitoxin module
MSYVAVKARLLKWGNSFGLRLSRRDVERLGLEPDKEIEVHVETSPRQTRVEDLPTFDLGRDAADRHDELFAESVLDDLRKKRR